MMVTMMLCMVNLIQDILLGNADEFLNTFLYLNYSVIKFVC